MQLKGNFGLELIITKTATGAFVTVKDMSAYSDEHVSGSPVWLSCEKIPKYWQTTGNIVWQRKQGMIFTPLAANSGFLLVSTGSGYTYCGHQITFVFLSNVPELPIE